MNPSTATAGRWYRAEASPTLALGIGVLLLLSGCAADAPAPTQAPTSSPLSPYLDALVGPSDPEVRREQANAYETQLAICLKEKGFDYIPRPWTIVDVSSEEGSGDPRDPGIPSADTVALEGYGIVAGDARMYVDPNGDLLADMSHQERREYGWARYGREMNPYQEDDPRAATWVSDGCESTSRQATIAQGALQSPDHASLAEGLLAVQQEALADDRLDGLYLIWADCMAENGRDGFEHPVDAPQSITDALSEIHGTSDSALEQDLAASEVELATADLECRTSSGYQEQIDRLWWSYEQAFVDEHRDELTRLDG